MAIEWKKTLLSGDSHALLSDIGTNSHVQIDTYIAAYGTHDHSASDPTQVSHANLTNVSSDQHHTESHTLASHSTKAHTELTGVTANQHHAQTHASAHQVGGGDLVNHDSLTGFVAAEHVSLPNTIANVLSNHTKAVHDALNIDADTLDGLNSSDFEPDITAGTTSQYWRGDKSWQTLLGTTSTTAFRGDYGNTAYAHVSATGASHSYINQSVTTGASPTFVKATFSQATGTAPFTVSSTTKVTNLNADLLDGYNSAETSAASTVVRRNSSGDINARLFRSEYDSTNATCNYIMTQIDTASDNYIRPSTKAQLIASLNLMTKAGGTFTGYVYARDHGTAATDMIVNVCYGTGSPPTANTTTIGTLFIKYV